MRRTNQLSIFYHPTTVVFVDDNQSFLDMMQEDMQGEFPARFFRNSKEALDFLNTSDQANELLQYCSRTDLEWELRDHLLGVHNIIYNPRRFDKVSVVVIDFVMPNLNGLEVSRLMTARNIKVILLTGEATKDLAVEAFNKGEIDRFVMKKNPDMRKILLQYIRELQQDYFINLSSAVLSEEAKFTQSSDYNLECLDDPVYIALFEKLYKEAQNREYYILNEQSCFLFLDENAKPSWLITHTDENLKCLAELAEASPLIAKMFEQGQQVFYLHGADRDWRGTFPWEKYVHSAKKLEGGKQPYYYSYVTDFNAYDIQPQQVHSFQHYLRSYTT